jgi:hypothetical protein
MTSASKPEYVKDYSKVLASIPTATAQLLVSRLGAEDGTDVVKFGWQHIFREDLLYLLDIPLHQLTEAVLDKDTTKENYSTLYAGFQTPEEEVKFFSSVLKPILLLRLEFGI